MQCLKTSVSFESTGQLIDSEELLFLTLKRSLGVVIRIPSYFVLDVVMYITVVKAPKPNLASYKRIAAPPLFGSQPPGSASTWESRYLIGNDSHVVLGTPF
jgi:hypothetical protein